jgi:hypothetical protein
MIYLTYILYIITILLWTYLLKIFHKLYILRTKLIENNCIIINDKKNSNNIINRSNQYFIDTIYKDLIFDINDSINIISHLKPQLNIILETYGGNIDSNDQIINHIITHNLKLNIYVFKYSQSAGTLLALCANKLYMTKNAFLGPTDPQITIDDITYSLKALNDLCENKDFNYIADKILLTYYDSKKLHNENIENIEKILKNKFKKNITVLNKETFIEKITAGNISHHTPLNYIFLNKYLNINLDIPKNIINIYNLYDTYI